MNDSESNNDDEIENEAEDEIINEDQDQDQDQGQDRREEDGQESVLTSDDRVIAMASHAGVYFGGFLVPLIIYLIKKDESEYIASHSRESLNFQISLMIYMLVSFILAFVVIGFFMIIALGIFSIVVTIIASIKSYEGKHYSYPMCIRFLK